MKILKIFIIICISYISICNSNPLDEDNFIEEGLAPNVNRFLLPNSQDAEIEDQTNNVSKFINAKKDSNNAFNDEEDDDQINNYNKDRKTEIIRRIFRIKIVLVNEVNATSVQKLPSSFLKRLVEGLIKHNAEREERIKEAEFFNQMRETQFNLNALSDRMEEENAINKRIEDLEKTTVTTVVNKEFRPKSFAPAANILNTRSEHLNWSENRKLMILISCTGVALMILIMYLLIYLYLTCRNKIPSVPKYFKGKGIDEAKLTLPGAMEKEFDC